MERADQRKISRNLVTVKKALKKDIDVIMDDLVEVGIFTKQTISEIEDAGPQMKCGVFISKLLRSCPRAYRCFKDILEEHGHQKLVISMERSKTLCSDVGQRWNEDREKTFLLPPPQVPSAVAVQTEEQETEKTDTEVVQLDRMMTFVLNTMHTNSNRTNKNNLENTTESELMEESVENDEFVNFFKTLRCSSVH